MPTLPSDENAAPARPSWQELKARVAMLAARSPAQVNKNPLGTLTTNAGAAKPFPVVIQKPLGDAAPFKGSSLANPAAGLPTPPPSFESPRQRAPQRPRQASPSPRKEGQRSSDVLLAGPAAVTSTPVKSAHLNAAKRTREMRSPAAATAQATSAFTSPNPRLRKNVRAEESDESGAGEPHPSPSKAAAWSRAHDLEDWRAEWEDEEEGSAEDESEGEDMDTSDVIPVVVGARERSRSPSKSPRKKGADPDESFVREAKEKGWDRGLPPSPVKTVYIVAPPLPVRRRESTLPRDDEEEPSAGPSRRKSTTGATPAPKAGRKSTALTPMSSLASRRGRRSTSVLTPPRSVPRLSATPVEPESPTDDPLLLYGPPKLEGLEEETLGDDTFADMRVKKEWSEGGVQAEDESGEDESGEEQVLEALDARSDTEEPQSFLDSIGGIVEESGQSFSRDEGDRDEQGYDDWDDGEGVAGDLSSGPIDQGHGEAVDDETDEDVAAGYEPEPLSFEEQACRLRQELTELSHNESGEAVEGSQEAADEDGASSQASDDEAEDASSQVSDEDEPEYVGSQFTPVPDRSSQTVEDSEEQEQPSADAQDDEESDAESEAEVDASISPSPSEADASPADISMARSEEEEDAEDGTVEEDAEDGTVEEDAEDGTAEEALEALEALAEESIVDAALPAEEVADESLSLASESDREEDEQEDPVIAVSSSTRSPTPLLPQTPAVNASELPPESPPATSRPTHLLVAALRGDISRSVTSRSRTSIGNTTPIHRFAIQADGSLEVSAGEDLSEDASALEDISASMESSSRTRAMMLTRKSRRPIIEISSLDGEAAARAAACLVLNHDYIRNGSLRSAPEEVEGGGGKGDLTADVSLHPGTDLTLPELLMEKELELISHARKGKGPLARPVPSTPRTMTAATPNGKSSFKIALPSTPSSPFIPGAFPKSAKKQRVVDPPTAETLHDKLVRKALAKAGHQEASLDHFRISSWVSLEEVVSAAIVHEARIAHRQLGMSSAEAQKRAALNVDRGACLAAFYEAHGVKRSMRGEASQWSDLRMQHRCASLQRRYLRLLEQRHPGTLEGDEKAVLDDTRDASAWHRLEKRYRGWEGYASVGVGDAQPSATLDHVSFGTPFRRGTHSTPARVTSNDASGSIYPALPAPTMLTAVPAVPPADTSADTSASFSTSFSSRSFADDVREAAAKLDASRKKKRSQLHEDVLEQALPRPSLTAAAARKRDELRQSWAQREAQDISRAAIKAPQVASRPAVKAPDVAPRTSGLGPRTSGGSSSVQPTALLFLPDSSHAEARRKALQLAQSRQNRLWKSPPSLRQAQKLAARAQPNSFGSLASSLAADVTASRTFWKTREAGDAENLTPDESF